MKRRAWLIRLILLKSLLLPEFQLMKKMLTVTQHLWCCHAYPVKAMTLLTDIMSW